MSMVVTSASQSPGPVSTPPHDIAKTSEAAIADVRLPIRDGLLSAPSFKELPPSEQQSIARDTVRVFSYMRDPDGILEELGERDPATLPGPLVAPPPEPTVAEPTTAQPAPPVAQALRENAVDATKRQLSEAPDFAGADFQAGAVEQGVEQFGAMVQKVDFPKFVGGLIKNVFQAIVESSIEQMRAYGDLIANVAKTTDQFMADNIGEAAGRDYLADKYPDVISIGTGGDDWSEPFSDGESADQQAAAPKAQATGEDAAVRLAQISKEMNVNPPVTDLSDANAELRLVTAARLEMAKSRQQLLSSMVMLGINRIVITDGSIKAKVIFDMRAQDTAKRDYTASMHDEKTSKVKTSMKASYGSWYTPVSLKGQIDTANEHVATVGSAVDETSESKAEVKARLSGDVRVNFKSDFLPLEKMATPAMMSTIQGNSLPFDPNQQQGTNAQ